MTALEYFETWVPPEELTAPQDNWNAKIQVAFAEDYAHRMLWEMIAKASKPTYSRRYWEEFLTIATSELQAKVKRRSSRDILPK